MVNAGGASFLVSRELSRLTDFKFWCIVTDTCIGLKKNTTLYNGVSIKHVDLCAIVFELLGALLIARPLSEVIVPIVIAAAAVALRIFLRLGFHRIAHVGQRPL